jgi:hypothetical protein
MALFAIGSQLPAVNISVAVLAALPHIREHRLYVTAGTGNGLMQAPEGIACLVVIEFRNRPNGPPGIGRVAVLAGNIQVPVRSACYGSLRPG